MVGLEFAQEHALPPGPSFEEKHPYAVLPFGLGGDAVDAFSGENDCLTSVLSFPRPLSMPSQPRRRQWMAPLGSCGGMAEVLPRTSSQHPLGLLRL